MATATAYKQIDIHAKEVDAWPANIPALTGPEAIRAARRLWRFSMGETFTGDIKITSGNRYNWYQHGVLSVNPDRGWRNFVHDLSHLFVSRCNPSMKPHSKFHARFEAKLIREVIKRGWLDGKLRDVQKAAVKPAKPGINDMRQAKLARITELMAGWERKKRRAERALAKYKKQARYYEKAIAK